MKSAKEITVEGKIQHFNISPKGVYEGMIVETKEGTVQVNFGPETGAYLSQHFELGKKVTLTAEAEGKSDKGKADHPVYALNSFQGNAKSGQHMNDSHEQVSVSGKVIKLNYALHGEVNGALLDSGDFIHTKPHGAKAVKIALGQKLEVEGETRPSYLNHRVIEAETINGIALDEHKPKKKHA